jgi:hypothetical protein
MVYTHPSEQQDVRVLESSSTHREVTANMPFTTTKNKKRGEKTHTDRCGNTPKQKCYAKASRIETKIQEVQ